MFNSRTVFVVGAGASKEVGLPVGSELAEQIANSLSVLSEFRELDDSDPKIIEALKEASQGSSETFIKLQEAARRVHDGMHLTKSIDSFLYTHRGDSYVQACAKISIAFAILAAEKGSGLKTIEPRFDSTLKFQALKKTWYGKFSQILFDQVPKEEMETVFDNISIISFNYDRCIEHFFIYAIASYFSVHPAEASEITNRLKIYHPYGVVGSLRTNINPRGLPYGSVLSPRGAVESSMQIRTYMERIRDKDILENIRNEVAEAETVVFLGFGFHPQNMELIKPTRKPKVARVIGTAFQFSDANLEITKEKIADTLFTGAKTSIERIRSHAAERTYLKNLECAKLLDEYERVLAQ